MKILFASPHCLLDWTSGAAISCRTILEQLAARGHEASAFSATIFDRPRYASTDEFLRAIDAKPVDPNAKPPLTVWRTSRQGVSYFISPSRAQQRRNMTAVNEVAYELALQKLVARRQPDIVLSLGGRALDRDCYRWFKDKGIPVVFYLVSDSYKSPRVFRDIDLVITDTQSTADFYNKKFGIAPLPVGKFVKPVTRPDGARKDCITFINPAPEKGVAIVLAITREAMRRGLATKFIVVQARGDLERAAKTLGMNLAALTNIVRLPVQDDMSRVWARTKILLCPSLWHESGARVIVEACSAGIPVLATDSGGTPELLREGGFLFPMPENLKTNYLGQIGQADLRPWIQTITQLMTDDAFFAEASARAFKRWQALNDPEPILRLERVLQKLIDDKHVERASAEQGKALGAGTDLDFFGTE